MQTIEYTSNNLELITIDRIIKYYDKTYSFFKHNEKNNEFDFTYASKGWALEQVTYFSKASKQVIEYEKALKKGKHPDPKRVEGSIVDINGDLLSYIGNGMTDTRKNLRSVISHKNMICTKRAEKEKIFKRIDLAITIPEDPLFNSPNSIKPLDEFVASYNSIFNRIFVVFYNSMFVFDAKTGKYLYINTEDS